MRLLFYFNDDDTSCRFASTLRGYISKLYSSQVELFRYKLSDDLSAIYLFYARKVNFCDTSFISGLLPCDKLDTYTESSLNILLKDFFSIEKTYNDVALLSNIILKTVRVLGLNVVKPDFESSKMNKNNIQIYTIFNSGNIFYLLNDCYVSDTQCITSDELKVMLHNDDSIVASIIGHQDKFSLLFKKPYFSHHRLNTGVASDALVLGLFDCIKYMNDKFLTNEIKEQLKIIYKCLIIMYYETFSDL